MIEEHGSLAEKFIKKGFWLYFFSFIIGPIGYIVKIIISGELSVSEVGVIYGIISLITLISAYNDLGLTDALNFFIPKYITEKRYDKVKSILAYTILAQLITGISIALFFFFGADFLAENYFKNNDASNVLKIFAFFFLGINIFQVISTFFMVVQNTFYNKIIELLRMLFVLFFVLSIYLLDISSIVNFSYSWLFGLYIGIIFGVIVFIKNYYIPYLANEKIIWSRSMFMEIFKYGLTIFIGLQASVILSQIDMQLIIYFLGTKEAGYYTNYLSIISIPFMLIGPIFALLYPMFSQMYSKGEIEKIKLVKAIFQKNFLVLSIAFSVLFFVFAESITYILFGPKFIESGIILKYSILFLGFNFLLQMNGNILASIGKAKERLYIVFIALGFNTIMNIIFINTIGVYGAALSTGIGWLLIWIMGEYFLGKEYRIGFDLKYLFKNTIILLIIGLLLFLFIKPIFENINRLYALGLFCFISAIYFSIFSIININELKFIITEVKKIRAKKD